jgi:hypothetical protein
LKLPVYWRVSLASTRSTPSFLERRGASTIVVGRGGVTFMAVVEREELIEKGAAS